MIDFYRALRRAGLRAEPRRRHAGDAPRDNSTAAAMDRHLKKSDPFRRKNASPTIELGPDGLPGLPPAANPDFVGQARQWNVMGVVGAVVAAAAHSPAVRALLLANAQPPAWVWTAATALGALLAAVGLLAGWILRRATALPYNCPTAYLRRRLYESLKRGRAPHHGASAASERADRPPPVVAYIGDSITHGACCGSWAEACSARLLADCTPVNAGVNSECVHNMLARLDRVLACEPAVVVVMAGTNDVKGIYNREWGAHSLWAQALPAMPSWTGYERDLDTLLARVTACASVRAVGVCTLCPMGEDMGARANATFVARANRAIAHAAKKHGATVLPVFATLADRIASDKARRGAKFKTPAPFEVWESAMADVAFSHNVLGHAWDRCGRARGRNFCVMSDGLHPNDTGARLIGELVAPFVDAHLRGPRETPLLLEHVNLNAPDGGLAKAFFADGLGAGVHPTRDGTRAENRKLLHVNLGLSQFHVPTVRGNAKGLRDPVRVPQVWSGTLELLTSEPLRAVAARLSPNPAAVATLEGLVAAGDARGMADFLKRGGTQSALGSVLAQCGVAVSEEESTEDEGYQLRVRGPFGNAFVLRAAPAQLTGAALAASAGAHPGGSRAPLGLVALARATHAVRPACAARVAAFYRDVLGVPCACEGGRAVVAFGRDDGDASNADTWPHARAWPPQQLVFEERDDAPAADAYDKDNDAKGYHVCLYLASHDAFVAAFKRAARVGAVYVNPRFEGGGKKGNKGMASAATLEDAVASAQFRVKDLKDPRSGVLGLVLEHEVRSPRHAACPFARRAVVGGGGGEGGGGDGGD